MSDERRKEPRRRSAVRILWSTLGRHEIGIDRLSDVSMTGARVATVTPAKIGEEIRFDLLDEHGEKFATGIAKVVWSSPLQKATGGMGISFLALGIDETLIATLALPGEDPFPTSSKKKGPPQLPGTVGGPPPMPGEHLSARSEKTAPEAPRSSPRVEAPRSSPRIDPRAEAEEEIEPQIEPLAIKKTGIVIGIDLGTTNTCASYVKDGRPQIIPGRTGTNTIPSMITFDPDGTFHVGQRAADRQVLYPLRTVYGSKRLVGRTYRADLAAELQQHFAYPLGEAEGQRFGVRLDERVVSMDTIAARVLDEVRATAEEHLKCPVEAAVITVPAYFSDVQREAVRRAAAEANLAVHRIVNEPTAAAVAYGHKSAAKARVAVWDFGGGTFDFSVVDVSDGRLEVIATGGDNFAGGQDFDDLLASHLLVEFQKKEALEDVDPDPQQIARLREAAETAKRALSAEEETVVEIHEFTRSPARTLRSTVTRAQFEQLAQGLVQRTLTIAKEVMRGSNIEPTEIDDVVLVGGTTRIPLVERSVGDLFGRRPSKRINPDEAVALGAALLADEIGSGSSPTLLDILPMSVGFGTVGLKFQAVVPRYSRLPISKEVVVNADLLGTVNLPVFQGESKDVTQNEYLCSVVVEDKSLWEKGKVTIRLSFDEHCVMAIDAKNARTGRALPVRLDRTRALDDIFRELGKYDGPPEPVRYKPPESPIGKVLGKLFKLFGR